MTGDHPPAPQHRRLPVTMMPSLEHCSCPVCGSDDAAPTALVDAPYAVVRCTDCDTWYLSPRLTEADMRSAYADESYYHGTGSGYARYAEQEKALRATFRQLIKQLRKRRMTGGSLLEVGCGYGYFLEEASPFFGALAGTEMSAETARRASRSAAKTYIGGLEAVPRSETYDLVLALQVIEHVYNPVEFIREARSHLRPSGWLLLATPDVGSVWRRVLGPRWPSFKSPEHVAYFSAGTLRRLLERGGACRVVRLPHPHAFPLGELMRKIGASPPRGLAPTPVWIPGTVIAMAARFE